MKLYEITVEPLSPLGTPLKGDTIFGHVCWQASEDPSLVKGGLEEQMRQYDERPFAVFSSAFPKLIGPGGTVSYAFKRPDLPLALLSGLSGGKLSTDVLKIKEQKKRRWMIVGHDLQIKAELIEFISAEELGRRARSGLAEDTQRQIRRKGPPRFSSGFVQAHNTINRLTFTTGTGTFAPYTQDAVVYLPGVKLALFVVIEEQATDVEKIVKALERVGKWGFGKDASIGYGRFAVRQWTELPIPLSDGANAMYMLGPCVPQPGSFKDAFFIPFVRFGKHGGNLARHSNPFKNPVIMADEGAVFVPANKDAFDRPYFGRPAMNVSKAQQEAVVQGYALYVPFRLEC